MIHSLIYRRALPLIACALIGAGLLMAAMEFTPLLQRSLARVSKKVNSAALLHAYGKLPLAFEANQGQADRSVKFLAHGSGYSLTLTNEGPLLAVGGKSGQEMLHIQLTGANAHSQVVGLDELPGKTNYFLGNDERQWLTNVPSYARVLYKNVYPGVNLVFYGNAGKLEYDFVVAPGANPRSIGLAFEGTQKLGFDARGNLVSHVGGVAIQQDKPTVYQVIQGARHVLDSSYVLTNAHQVGFAVAHYDRRFPLVIDPTLVYSTYLGGNYQDLGNAIAVDSTGNVYVAGQTVSSNFPTKHAFQPKLKGSANAFVSKLNASGTAFMYSTYLGGSVGDYGQGIAIDSAGNAYITGFTQSADFPTKHAFQPALRGGYNAFVTKLNAKGNALIYSTYLGGSAGDSGQGIAVDSAGNAYIAGFTSSNDFPTKQPMQPKLKGAWNAFVTKFNASGKAPVYSTYLGGSDTDYSYSIALDGSGNAYVSGQTESPDFPTVNAFQSKYAGNYDAFVSKLNANGSALVYSTYLGGNGGDSAYHIAVDSADHAYVTGYTSSTNFPVANAFQGNIRGAPNAFVTKFSVDGRSLVYSTYLGGSSQEYGQGVAVDSVGNAYVTGSTSSTDFPLVNPLQQYGGGADAYITKFDASGHVLFSTYFGGSNTDRGYAIAADNAGNVYVTGYTGSSDLPVLHPFQKKLRGLENAFIVKIGT